MNRLGTTVLAAVEAIVAVGVGLGIALVPLTLLWGFEYGLQIDWSVFWRAAGSVWLVGHGVDVSFTLSAAAAKASGVSGAGAPIHVTVAALGFAIVTAWLGARAGRRLAETEHRVTGTLVATALVAVLGLLIALSSTSVASEPVLWQAIVLPALWFGVPAWVASEVCRHRRGLVADPVTERVAELVERVPSVWRVAIGFGLRAGTAASAIVVAVAGIVVGFLVLGSFAEVITLYERSHAGVVGGLAITVGQLAFLPDFVGWAVSWIIGPGFALGTGSNVSPIATTLGPIPGLPVFGALPASGHVFGLVWVLVPVIAGFAAGGVLRPRLVRALGPVDSAAMRAVGGVATGLTAGVLTGLVAWATSGSFGPGRLATVGPHPWTVGAFAALEVGVPAVVALAIGSDLVRLPERSAWTTRERWQDDGAEPVPATDGGLLDALDRAGAGRTTEVHRFVVADGSPHATDARSSTADTDTVDPDIDDTDTDGSDTVDTGRSAPVRPDGGRIGRTPARTVATPRRRIPGVRYAEETEPIDRADGATPADVAGSGGTPAPTDRAGSRGTPAPTARAARPVSDDRDPDDDVELPEWARVDDGQGRPGAGGPGRPDRGTRPRVADTSLQAERTERTHPGNRSIRDRLRQVADGARDRADDLRDRATELRERVTGADAEREHRSRPEPRGPRTDEQPAFPWSTDEFVAGRDDVDDAVPESSAQRPGQADGQPRWDVTDQIPEHELPWWKRSGGGDEPGTRHR